MGNKNYTIYLRKTDLSFLKKEIGFEGFMEFEEIKEFDDYEYEIIISDYDLSTLIGFISVECNPTDSRRKALRLDRIATELERHQFPRSFFF